MDRRYLLMLIIIIICCINLSIIVNNSDIVGSASASVENYLFSVPEGFSLYETNGDSTVIQNKNNNIDIRVETNLNNRDNYYERLNYIENETNNTILSEGTVSIDNITVYSVYYKTNDDINKSAFYFEKDNRQFKILVSNFNYDDRELTLDYVTYIIKSIKYNNKMG